MQSGSAGPLIETLDVTADGSGESRAVLLTGVPGVGKSTTLTAIARGLDARGMRVYRVVADEMSRRQPFGLVSDLVGIPPVFPPLWDTADRVLNAVETLCATGPVALCADDLQHADADSLSLLGRLVSSTRDLPLSLAMARRTLPVRESLNVLAARPDVFDVEIVGLDDDGLSGLVRQRYPAPPSAALRSLLTTTGGNPFHAGTMLDELGRQGRLAVVDDQVDVIGDPGNATLSLQGGVRAQLALLDRAARDLLQVLAVWGRPAGVRQLAAVLGVSPVTLLGPVQDAVQSQVAQWTDSNMLTFRHDLYHDVIYADLAPPLRRILHEACAAELRASGGISTEIAQHTGDATGATDPALALHTAATDLAHAPAQAAELLASAAAVATPGPQSDAIAVARAGALAAAGQMTAVEEVARVAIDSTTDSTTRDTLTRLMLHAMLSSGDSGGAITVIDGRLEQPIDDHLRDAMTHLRRWALVLGGRMPVTDSGHLATGSSAAGKARAVGSIGRRTGAALVPQAMDLFLQARCASALELAIEARDIREASGSPVWADGATAPIWPAWFALYSRGPAEARELSVQARRHAQERGRGWLAPLHLFVAGTIDQFAGRWDDASAEFETGLEGVEVTGGGWRSRAWGGLLQIQIRRGEFDRAATGLAQFTLGGWNQEFGLPMVPFAQILLAESQGRAPDVVELARRSWATPLDSGRLLWALLAGPEIARVAMQGGDERLLKRVAVDIARIPIDEAPALAPAADLVRAMVDRDPGRAAAAASAFRLRGNAGGEVAAWEEASVAAADRGDQAQARNHAARCIELAAGLGAVTVERRLTARLRAHAVRLGVSGARRRPASGWGSLTPTELQVAELVGEGMTSPEIATRLFISPRTVQTHISHSLRKLDLRSRVELATTVARNH